MTTTLTTALTQQMHQRAEELYAGREQELQALEGRLHREESNWLVRVQEERSKLEQSVRVEMGVELERRTSLYERNARSRMDNDVREHRLTVERELEKDQDRVNREKENTKKELDNLNKAHQAQMDRLRQEEQRFQAQKTQVEQQHMKDRLQYEHECAVLKQEVARRHKERQAREDKDAEKERLLEKRERAVVEERACLERGTGALREETYALKIKAEACERETDE